MLGGKVSIELRAVRMFVVRRFDVRRNLRYLIELRAVRSLLEGL